MIRKMLGLKFKNSLQKISPSPAVIQAIGRFLIAAFLFAVSPLGLAQEETKPSLTPYEVGWSLSPVIIDGETLFQVRGVTAYPATRRAKEIAARIVRVAATPTRSSQSLQVVELQDTTAIVSGNEKIVQLYDGDAALEGANRTVLAQAYLLRIREAIDAYREARKPDALIRGGLYVIAATLIFGLFVWLSRLAVRRLDAWFGRRVHSHLVGLEAQSFQIVRARQVWVVLNSVRRLLFGLVLLFAVFVYINFSLGQLPWTRGLANSLFGLVVEPIQVIGDGILRAIPDLVFLTILFFIVRYALQVLKLFFGGVAEQVIHFENFPPELAWPTYRLVRVGVIAFGLVVAFPYIPGSDSDAFKAISVFLGVVFSLGGSSTIANMVAGYTLIYRRAFKIGDRIRVGEHYGDVTQMRNLVTYLRSVKNEEIVVPNSLLLNSSVVNYSTLARSGKLVLHTTVGIGYETPWRQVEAMLLQAARQTDGVLPDPEPYVLQKALGDFCVTYEVNVFCDQPHEIERIYTALHRNILDVFNEHGVQIMTPAYVADPADAKVVPKARWYLEPADPSS